MRAYAHYNPFNVREASEYPDWSEVFQNDNQIDLEIGFSNGDWLIDYAKKFPERNIVGVETRSKFIEHVKERIKKENLSNAYVLQANINTAIDDLFEDATLANVHIMFPDPWYKKGHLKRRVVQTPFIEILAKKMLPEGELHIATDKEFLAQDMLAVMEGGEEEPGFAKVYINKAGQKNWSSENIEGITTPIERYHLKLGNAIYRIVFNRCVDQTTLSE